MKKPNKDHDLPRALTDEQERRLLTANIVASMTSSSHMHFRWWVNAHTESSYRGQWVARDMNGYSRDSGTIIDADTIDELFDKTLKPYEGAVANDAFVRFEETYHKLCILKHHMETTIPGYKANRFEFFVERKLEGRIKSTNGRVTASFAYHGKRDGGFRIHIERSTYGNQCLQYMLDIGEVAQVAKGIVDKIKSLGMPFDHVDW